MDQNLNVRPEMLKVVEKNIKATLQCVSICNNLVNRTPIVQKY
jgi:hypothetical protein